MKPQHIKDLEAEVIDAAKKWANWPGRPSDERLLRCVWRLVEAVATETNRTNMQDQSNSEQTNGTSDPESPLLRGDQITTEHEVKMEEGDWRAVGGNVNGCLGTDEGWNFRALQPHAYYIVREKQKAPQTLRKRLAQLVCDPDLPLLSGPGFADLTSAQVIEWLKERGATELAEEAMK